MPGNLFLQIIQCLNLLAISHLESDSLEVLIQVDRSQSELSSHSQLPDFFLCLPTPPGTPLTKGFALSLYFILYFVFIYTYVCFVCMHSEVSKMLSQLVGQQAPGDHSSLPLSPGVTDMLHLNGCWRSELGSSCWYSKDLTHWVIPQPYYLHLKYCILWSCPTKRLEYWKFGPQLLKLVLEVLETLGWVGERSMLWSHAAEGLLCSASLLFLSLLIHCKNSLCHALLQPRSFPSQSQSQNGVTRTRTFWKSFLPSGAFFLALGLSDIKIIPTLNLHITDCHLHS